MKRLAPLCILLLLVTAACSTWLFQPIDVGKTFGVIQPDEFPIFKEPSLQSEVYYLDDPEVFTTELAVCDGGGGWWTDCILTIVSMPYRGFLRARFEDGDVGYVNFTYFFPDYATPIISEGEAEVLGYTVPEYIERARRIYKEGREKYLEAERKRQELVMSSPWPEETKRMIIEREIETGMTKEQVLLSQNPADNMPQDSLRKVREKVGPEGVREEWACGGTAYYFFNDRLVGWDTTDGRMDGNRRIGACPYRE